MQGLQVQANGAVMDDNEFKIWLRQQSREHCAIIAARAAARVVPIATSFGNGGNVHRNLALLTLRATLTSGVAGKVPTLDVMAAAASAAAYDLYVAPAYAVGADAARASDYDTDAADAAYASVSASADAAVDVAISDATVSAYASAFAAASADVTIAFSGLFDAPLWGTTSEPDWLTEAVKGKKNLLNRGADWDFWRRWYQGMLTGQPLDWELQRRVALIPKEDWAEGVEHIAEVIEKIEREWRAEQGQANPRAPEFEPASVEELLKHPRSVSASLAAQSDMISSGLAAFIHETGLNETPDFMKPIEAVPASLGRIQTILLTPNRSAETEEVLRQEIGKLNAKVVWLEQELERLKSDLEQQKKPWFGKIAVLGSSVAAIVSAGWVVSADELGPRKRLETLAEYWHYFSPEIGEKNGQPIPVVGVGTFEDKDVPKLSDPGPSDLPPVSVEDLPTSKS